jgi:predicted MPP superfamily phosphohydrolase
MSNMRMLEEQFVTLERGTDKITLYGIGDPGVFGGEEKIANKKRAAISTVDGYSMLLFHRANMLDMFAEDDFNLVISGHMHGGQVRLPFVGGFAKSQVSRK